MVWLCRHVKFSHISLFSTSGSLATMFDLPLYIGFLFRYRKMYFGSLKSRVFFPCVRKMEPSNVFLRTGHANPDRLICLHSLML